MAAGNTAKDILERGSVVYRGEVTAEGFRLEGQTEVLPADFYLRQFLGQSVSIQIRPLKRQYVSFEREESARIHGKIEPILDPTPAVADRGVGGGLGKAKE
ncbi:MAG: hypothetical protein ABSB38_03555 [Dehalococcoidia bacterium]|jgi:hypothetical protein